MNDDISKLRQILQKVDFFNKLNIEQLDSLINKMKKRKANKGEEIIKQGEVGDRFFLVSSGKVSVHIKKGMKSSVVANLGEGDFFGEMALVSDMPRTATVVAETVCDLFVLHKNDFKQILMANPKISAIINEVLSKRKMSNK